jgi:hypothetical protein
MKAYPRKSPADTMFMAAWPWFSREKLLKIFKVSLKRIQNFDPHFKNLYLARKWVQTVHIGLV